MNLSVKNYLLYGAFIMACGCNKQNDWLDIKPNRADVIPTKLSDYQALLDNDDTYMNTTYPYLGQISTDDFFVPFTTFQSVTATQRNAHTWQPDIFQGANASDWNIPSTIVGYANICLDGIQKIKRDSSNTAAWDNVRGSALFFRSLAIFMLAQEFATPYKPATTVTDLGVPVRTSSDVNVVSVRATVRETYDRITTELLEAVSLLPAFPAWKTRPSAAAAEALLARVYLTMQDYNKSAAYAGKVLARTNDLIDYNSLNAAASFAFPNYTTGNKEVLFYATGLSTDLHSSNAYVDTFLYRSYAANDLRRSLFFRATGPYTSFRGSYAGRATPFNGIALNEMYLIRSESNARLGNTSAAMSDLNTLLVKRWKTGTFVPLTATSASDALIKILAERRKELLLYANARWDDLRRLNQEPAFAKTLVRIVNGQTFTLPPNDPRYTLPIPDVEIRYSGIQQNPR